MTWFWRTEGAELPPTLDREAVVLDTVGSLIDGIATPHGRFVVTTARILFLPSQLRFVPRLPFEKSYKKEIWLRDIRATEAKSVWRGLLGGFPGFSPFTVLLDDGSSYTFQIPAAKYVSDRIETLAHTIREAATD